MTQAGGNAACGRVPQRLRWTKNALRNCRYSLAGNPSGLAFGHPRGRGLMIGLPRSAARAIAAAFLLITALMTSLDAAHAAGALAVGVCGAYGYGYDFRNLA